MQSKAFLAVYSFFSLAVHGLADEKPAPTQPRSLWRSVGSTQDIRESSGLVLLPDGRVLVAGGHADSSNRKWRLIGSAELYDPKKESWQLTGPLVQPRQGVGDIVLLKNGKVLLAGEHDSRTGAELYDPATGKWSATGFLRVGRGGHTTTLLQDGRILVTGGIDYYAKGEPVFASAEVYDPDTEKWNATGSMAATRFLHKAVCLPSGKVLVAGGVLSEGPGEPLASAELYDPASGTWKPTGSVSQERQNHTLTLLRDGKVLVAGGRTGKGRLGQAADSKCLTSAEIYDPQTGTWTATGSMKQPRCQFTATVLADGRVLVVGGVAWPVAIALGSAEIYDPASGTWSSAGTLATSRWNHRAVLLPSGEVLVVGGCGPFGHNHLKSVEVFTPP